MKILLFLIGVVELVLIRRYIKKDYLMDKKTQYTFYILSLLIFALFSYTYPLNIATILFISAIVMLLNIVFIDYKYRVIPNKLVLLIFIIAIVNFIINISSYKSLLFGVLFAIVFCLILYKFSSFGGGDVKLLISLSLLIGFYNTFLLFLISFLLASIYGGILMLRKKANLKSAIPFGPFVGIGFIILVFI